MTSASPAPSPALPPHALVLRGPTLRGEPVILEPMSIAGLQELAPLLCRPEVFAGGHAGGPAAMPGSEADYVEFFAGYCPWHRGGRSYIVRHGTRAVGTTSLYGHRPEVDSVQVGYTAYAPQTWGSGLNPATKLTLLEWVFEHGFRRVTFEVAGGNARSRAALGRLGAHCDGIVRSDRRLADGTIDDTVVFSILSSEWPCVAANLHERVSCRSAAR